MTIKIVKSGIMDTLQDRGRHGFAKWGVNVSGSMDPFASQVANALVGNALDAPVVELHFPCGEFYFEEPAVIAIAGADFSPTANDMPLPLWKAVIVAPHTTLIFRKKEKGARAYLAVGGTLEADTWLGSASTNLKIGVGGYRGRPLRKGDAVNVRPPEFHLTDRVRGPVALPWSINAMGVYKDSNVVNFICGREWGWLAPSTAAQFGSIPFRITPSSDRMAIKLAHPPLEFRLTDPLLSTAVVFGTIQALPGGALMILMADRQTTGGYPQIGHVAGAHLPKLAQLEANETLSLCQVDVQEAEKMLLSLQGDIRRIQRSCQEQLKAFYEQH